MEAVIDQLLYVEKWLDPLPELHEKFIEQWRKEWKILQADKCARYSSRLPNNEAIPE